jgi:Protein of unknown function (DUF2934)
MIVSFIKRDTKAGEMTGRRQRIRKRAYEFWEAEGRQHGNDLADWFRAEAEIPLRVTFDTNVFDKVTRPTVYPKDPDFQEMNVIHDAVKDARVQAFISDTMITLEGIGGDDRATVFGSTGSRSSIAQTSEDTFTITARTEQPDRKPINPKQADRFVAAFQFGFSLLGTPRIAMPRAEEQYYATEDAAALGERLDRFTSLLTQIESRGLGSARAKGIAARFPRSGIGPWFNALGAAKDIHETREVARAVAEWADADSIAAHYAYGNDFFCTLDAAKAETNRGDPAVFDAENRAWLTENFGIQFVTLAQLAELIRA